MDRGSSSRWRFLETRDRTAVLRDGSLGSGEAVAVRKAIRLQDRLLGRASSNWPACDTRGEAGLALVEGLVLGGLCEGLGEGLKE